MKTSVKGLIALIICLLIIIGNSNEVNSAAAFKGKVQNKSIGITQRDAVNKIKLIDKKVIRLIPCDERNTIKSVVNKYKKNYYMFLANYGVGEEEYTSEALYLVNKKIGTVYTLMVDGAPVPLVNAKKNRKV